MSEKPDYKMVVQEDLWSPGSGITKERPAFVGSVGSSGDVAMSIYHVPEGEEEFVGDILFRLDSLQQAEDLCAYLQVALPILKEKYNE